MKAKELKDRAKFTGWYEDSTEEVTEYIFTEEEMSIFWSQLCDEQRDICTSEAKKHGLASAVRNAPEPEFNETEAV